MKEYSCRLKKIRILEDVVKKLSTIVPEGSANDASSGQASLRIALMKLQWDVTKDLLSESEGSKNVTT